MTYSPNTPITGSARGSPDMIADWAIGRGAMRPDDLREYLETVYRLAPVLDLNADVVVAQAIVETSDRVTGQKPFVSVPWTYGLNPAGIAVTDDSQWRVIDFRTGETAARAHLLHLSLYVHGATVPSGFLATDDPRWQAAIDAGYDGIADTLADLANRWAVDSSYGEKIADRMNQMAAAGLLDGPATEPEPEDEPMAYTAHDWPGLPNPVYLPDSLPASIQLVHAAGWWESAASTRQTTFTQHFTGNMNSSAQSERDWAQGGGRADIGSTGSYQIIVDGREVIITLPFNKAAGHAANNTGNYTSYASEMAIRGGYEAAFQNAAHVAAGVHVAKDWQVDTALLQHWNWLRANGERKNCPSIIRDRGDWSRFVATVTRNAAALRSHLAGGGAPDPWPYPAPAIIPELDAISREEGIAPFFVDGGGTRWTWVGDRVRIITPTKRYRRASLDAESVGPDFKIGDEFDLDWVTFFEGADWGYTPAGTRIYMAAVERISDSKGEIAA